MGWGAFGKIADTVVARVGVGGLKQNFASAGRGGSPKIGEIL